VDVGWFASPALLSARKSQSPLRSPVNIRPVRFPPWAAGARPTTSMRAFGSPKPGSGFPQYAESRKAARFSRATLSRYATSRGHLRQPTISRFSSSRARAGSTRGPNAALLFPLARGPAFFNPQVALVAEAVEPFPGGLEAHLSTSRSLLLFMSGNKSVRNDPEMIRVEYQAQTVFTQMNR
jgi:hypothetical protein